MATSGRIAIPLTNLIASLRGGLSPEAYDELLVAVQAVVRKTAHFSEYAVLGLLVRLLMGSYALPNAAVWAWVAATCYAGTDELHQLLGGQRTGMWQDVALDSCGVLAGVLLVWFIRRHRAGRAAEQA